ncbi:MAG TPA: phosphomannomutase/phosphoglucomutase [Legionella sp.]|nr:phosphomannomutase/phosphoglucomutase [Legionella sp.]
MPYNNIAVIPRIIFKEYDIRGLVGTELNESVYYVLGLTIGTELLKQHNEYTIVIGRDSRLSSYPYSKALSQGLIDAGVGVINTGALPTPLVHFAMYHNKIDSSLMITASHNPAQYNGLKINLNGQICSGEALQDLFVKAKNLNFKTPAKPGIYQEVAEEDTIRNYIAAVKDKVQINSRLKVVVDCGNAIGGVVVPQLLRSLGCDVVPLFCDVLSSFPNHHPDPAIEENMKALTKAVITHQADIGLAFDGDGDRLGVVDKYGKIIKADKQLIVFIQALLQNNPEQAVVYDIKCSNQIEQYIKMHHGIGIMTKTGASNIMAQMDKHQAILGGEFSGHFYFKEWFYDDGIFAAAKTLELISKNLSMYEEIPESFSTPELKINIADEEKEWFMRQLLKKAPFESSQMITIDGLRVNFPFGWGLIRISNTTPNLTARFEADNDAHLSYIKKIFRELILQVNPALKIPF